MVGVASILGVIMCALMFTLYRYAAINKFKVVPGMFTNLFLAQVSSFLFQLVYFRLL